MIRLWQFTLSLWVSPQFSIISSRNVISFQTFKLLIFSSQPQPSLFFKSCVFVYVLKKHLSLISLVVLIHHVNSFSQLCWHFPGYIVNIGCWTSIKLNMTLELGNIAISYSHWNCTHSFLLREAVIIILRVGPYIFLTFWFLSTLGLDYCTYVHPA